MDGENTPRGMSRRDLLKKGGLVLGAAAWMTPAMQVLNMTPAAAEDGFDPQCESDMESVSGEGSGDVGEDGGSEFEEVEVEESTRGNRGDADIPSPPDPTD